MLTKALTFAEFKSYSYSAHEACNNANIKISKEHFLDGQVVCVFSLLSSIKLICLVCQNLITIPGNSMKLPG